MREGKPCDICQQEHADKFKERFENLGAETKEA